MHLESKVQAINWVHQPQQVAHTGSRPDQQPPEYRSSLLPTLGTQRPCRHSSNMSTSLIGRSGSSAFRLSTTTVSMSLTGSCFSSESAPGPFHHGIRGRGGTIFTAALPSDERQVQADIRTHLIHRPARDIFPRLGGTSSFLLSHLVTYASHDTAASRVHRNSVPSTQMRCMITANRRASATIAFFIPRRLAIFIAQALSQDHFVERTSMLWAAS